MVTRRRDLGLIAAFVIVAAAGCGSGSSSASPMASSAVAGLSPDARILGAGLGANLDKLASYQFSEVIYSGADGGSIGASASAGASAGASASAEVDRTASLRVDGTVVNGGSKSIAISMSGVRYIVVGSTAWSSVDGQIWASVDDLPDVLSLLPAAYYSLWFDANASGFSAVGSETHNGVVCTRFSGGASLGNLYASATGMSFQADLWIAADGSFPVGGRYLIPVGGHISGFSFEITNLNDKSNAVASPSDVVALPS